VNVNLHAFVRHGNENAIEFTIRCDGVRGMRWLWGLGHCTYRQGVNEVVIRSKHHGHENGLESAEIDAFVTRVEPDLVAAHIGNRGQDSAGGYLQDIATARHQSLS